MHQIRFWLGLCPRPRWGSLQRSHRPLAVFGGRFAAGGGAGLGKRRERGREGREGRGSGGEGPQVTVEQGPSETCYATELVVSMHQDQSYSNYTVGKRVGQHALGRLKCTLWRQRKQHGSCRCHIPRSTLQKECVSISKQLFAGQGSGNCRSDQVVRWSRSVYHGGSGNGCSGR